MNVAAVVERLGAASCRARLKTCWRGCRLPTGGASVSVRAVVSFDSQREGGMRDEKGEGRGTKDAMG
jgi:hypothetical protein